MNNSFNLLLKSLCKEKNNRLCIGLDVDIDRINNSKILDIEDLKYFTKDIIDATIDICPVYKINLAFYECYGYKGYIWMEEIIDHVNKRSIVIADGKRGDIGNTAKKYANSIFKHFGFDAITLSPYMGQDSLIPFIEDKSKGAFILCLTSNSGSNDFQKLESNGIPLYISVLHCSQELNKNNNVGIVVGATKSKYMDNILKHSYSLPWLVPGVGAQGGDLKKSVLKSNLYGTGIINISRGILYSGSGSINDIKKSAVEYTKCIRKYLNE